MRSSVKRTAVVATAAALLTAACSSGTTTTKASDSAGTAPGKQTTVNVWASVDQPVMDGLQAASDELTAGTDIKIKWQSVSDINTVVMTKIGASDAPDIALIPQPGVVADMVKRGGAFPEDAALDMTALKASMVPGTLDAGTVDGKLYGMLVSMNVKGLVWYNKPAWDAAGYKAPKSIDELNTLTDKIKADGKVPWCMGIESDTATGWPATDWFETLIMKYGGVDGYNKWVAHTTAFSSPIVNQAGAEFEKLMFTDGNVLGGRTAIPSTNFGTAGTPMFDAAGPQCWLYNQGSFITGFFPDATKADLDKNVGVFGFPPAKAGGDNPVEGGGDMAVMMNEKATTAEALKILSNVKIGDKAAGSSSFISPHKDFDVSLYANETTRSVAKVAYGATAFLFDGSDAMPGEVGAGSFWTEMTSWIAGQEDLPTALKNIDASWPKS